MSKSPNYVESKDRPTKHKGPKMTIHEIYLSMVEEAERDCQQKLEILRVDLKKKQEKCKHKWGKRVEDMFYALGETAPGKRCRKCGVQKHTR